MYFVDQDFEKIPAVDVILARRLSQENQVFFTSELFRRFDGHLAVERPLRLYLRLVSRALQLLVLQADAGAGSSRDTIDDG